MKDTSRWLNISGLCPKEWPKALKDKENLIIKLSCKHNQLTSLPLFPNLTKLRCFDNRLTSLPLFPNLTHLLCHSNQLTSLPLYPKLIKLGCHNNKLTSLPLLPNLTKLWCFNNQLTSLPLLPNLTGLSCEANQLISLPFFPNLNGLFCNKNKLFSTELTEWKKVWRLRTLRRNEKRKRGLDKVIKVLKNRLYLPRLDTLKQELVYSPNHPGKFYKNLRLGNWRFETKSQK